MAPDGDVIKKPYEHEPLGVLTLLPKVFSIQDSAVITLLRNDFVRNDETQTQKIFLNCIS